MMLLPDPSVQVLCSPVLVAMAFSPTQIRCEERIREKQAHILIFGGKRRKGFLEHKQWCFFFSASSAMEIWCCVAMVLPQQQFLLAVLWHRLLC
jgi:hypothetical protein